MKWTDSDPLAAPRGVVNGLLLVGALYTLALLVWLVLR